MLVDVTDALQDLIDAVAEGDRHGWDTPVNQIWMNCSATAKVEKSGTENPRRMSYYRGMIMLLLSLIENPMKVLQKRALTLFIIHTHYLKVLSHLDQKWSECFKNQLCTSHHKLTSACTTSRAAAKIRKKTFSCFQDATSLLEIRHEISEVAVTTYRTWHQPRCNTLWQQYLQTALLQWRCRHTHMQK